MQQQTIRRVNQRETTQGILANTSAFHQRIMHLSIDEFNREIDRSIEAAGFQGNLEQKADEKNVS